MTTEITGNPVDQFLTADTNGRGTIQTLYQAASDHHEGSPLKRTASTLHEITSGNVVLINIGFIEPPALTQETDGPIGAASLARALKTEFGVHPIVLAEERGLSVVKAALRAFGLNASNTTEAKDMPWTVGVESFPTDRDRVEEVARELRDHWSLAKTHTSVV